MRMIRKKSAGPAIFLKVVSAMPKGAHCRLAGMMHAAPPVPFEKNAFAGPRLCRQEITDRGISSFRKSCNFLVRQQDGNCQAGEIAAAGAPLRTCCAQFC